MTDAAVPSTPATRRRFFVVPAGTPVTTCSGATCGRRLYWIRNPETRGKRPSKMPISCDVPGGVDPSTSVQPTLFDPTPTHHGRGVLHRGICPHSWEMHQGRPAHRERAP